MVIRFVWIVLGWTGREAPAGSAIAPSLFLSRFPTGVIATEPDHAGSRSEIRLAHQAGNGALVIQPSPAGRFAQNADGTYGDQSRAMSRAATSGFIDQHGIRVFLQG